VSTFVIRKHYSRCLRVYKTGGNRRFFVEPLGVLHKRPHRVSRSGLSCCCAISVDYDKLFTYFVNLDLLFEALFLWITFFLANRSSIEVTRGNNAFASSAEVVFLNFLIALRVVFA